jgi:hypothetical protein
MKDREMRSSNELVTSPEISSWQQLTAFPDSCVTKKSPFPAVRRNRTKENTVAWLTTGPVAAKLGSGLGFTKQELLASYSQCRGLVKLINMRAPFLYKDLYMSILI